MNNYSFIVELGKNSKNDKIFNQILLCSCGNKQKSKMTVKRTILRNSETLHEDKYSLDQIICTNCKRNFNIINNLYGIKVGQKIQVEVKYEIDDIELNDKKLKILKKNKLFYYFDIQNNDLRSFILTDFLIFDESEQNFQFFSDGSFLQNDLNFLDSGKSIKNIIYNSKNNKLTFFDINNKNFINNFFDFEETINYINLEICFNYFDEILKSSYEYNLLIQEKFLANFRISSKIEQIIEDDIVKFYVSQKDFFGSDKLLRKKLNVGDYLNKLRKLSNITCIFTSYPQISSLYKVKGLEFIICSFEEELFAPLSYLKLHNSTNSQKILESSCKYYFKDSFVEPKDEKADFKISPFILKKINDPADLIIIYHFYLKQNLSKSEIELLFSKNPVEDVIKVLAKIVSSANIRNVNLSLKNIQHILKTNLFLNDDEWLIIYYDTINTLKLIVNLIHDRKKNNLKLGKYNNLVKLSENKLYDIKNYEKLKELHDEMFAIYRAIEDDSKDALFKSAVKKYKFLNTSIDYFNFTVISNLKELSKEGLIMKHCIYTYLNDILKGSYLAIRIKDSISKEKATLGIKIDSEKMYLQQLKGYENSRSTSLLINTVLKFCEEFKIIIYSSDLHKTDIESNKNLEKRMKNYLSYEESEKLRKQKKDSTN